MSGNKNNLPFLIFYLKRTDGGDHHILDGHFTSPFVHHLPGIMPPEVQTARYHTVIILITHKFPIMISFKL